MAAPPIAERHKPHFHRKAPVLESVRVATTANITIATALNNGDTLDGITLATDDRVLVKDQSTGSQNGIYVVGVTPVRDYDQSTEDPAFGFLVRVRQGTANAGTLWANTNTSAPTIDTTALTFAQVSGSTVAYRALLASMAPVSYWRLGEASGTVAADEMGTNPGTYVGTPTLGATGALAGDADTAVTFNGTSQYVTVPSITVPASITIAAWVKAAAWNAGGGLAGQWDSSTGAMIYSSATNLNLFCQGTVLVGPALPSTGAWHLFVGTHDGTQARTYLDGSLSTGPTTQSSPGTNGAAFEIAAYANHAAGTFADLTIDEVAIWNRALSAAEVAALYAAAPVLAVDAASVSVADAGGYFTGTNVETVLQELGALIEGVTAHGNTGATETFDALTGWHSATLNAATVTASFTGATSGLVAAMVLELAQDATGSRLVTWPASVVWPGGVAPTLSTTAAAVDVLTFFSRDGGTTWYGFATGGAAIDYAETGDLAAVGETASAGVSTEVPRADHVHVIAAAAVQNAGHWEVIVSGTAPPVAVSNPADDDWLYGWVAG